MEQKIKIQLENFEIAQIHRSGQCFRMEDLGEGRFGILAAEKYLEICQHGQECEFYCSREDMEGFWKDYFDLQTDYGKFIREIDEKDQYLAKAARLGQGIRILHQDLWEMIVSFLISQQNNIPRIRRCIANICERYGERRQNSQGRTYDTFPRPEALAEAREEDLRDCNLGYRSRYIKKTARMVLDGEISLEAVRNMKYPEAREELLKLYGVGEKVADCICLFALHQMEAFPVDTHIRQALEKHYPQGFPFDRYKDCSGVMQQYIFYYELFQ
mgnify:FL=1